MSGDEVVFEPISEDVSGGTGYAGGYLDVGAMLKKGKGKIATSDPAEIDALRHFQGVQEVESSKPSEKTSEKASEKKDGGDES